MRTLLAEVVAELGLQPGQTHVETVGNREIEVRVREKAAAVEPAGEPSPFADMVMLQPWFEIPPSPPAVIVKNVVHVPDFPKPIILDESDLAPE